MNVKHPSRLYKSDRLNHIVSRMRLNQDITPAKLAEELNVSERTIYRDLRFLESGNALKKRYSRREGRYMLETELHLPPLLLTPSEALALYNAASNPALSNDNFYGSDLRSGLTKVAALLAPSSGRTGENGGQASPHTVPGEMSDSIQRPIMEIIRRAMRSNHKLRLHYWSASTSGERDLTVAPYDLRQLHGNWYLLANSEQHRRIRLFKVSRMRAVEMLNDRFRHPRRFSADIHFERAAENLPCDEDIVVKIRFSPSVTSQVVDSRGRQFTSMQLEPGGALICTAIVSSLREIAWWVHSYGPAAEVLEPEELRTEFAQAAQSLARLYAASAAKG